MLEYAQDMFALALKGEAKGIFFWAALYFLVTAIYSLIFQIRVRKWPSVAGNLLKLDKAEHGAKEWAATNQDYRASTLYVYQVDGKTYEGKRLSPWGIVASANAKFVLDMQMQGVTYLPNNQVRVFYDPRNPQKSYLILPGKIGMLVTVIFGSWVMLAYLAVHVY